MRDFILTLSIDYGWVLLFVIGPPFWILCAYVGMKWQRYHWMMDHPYQERLKALKDK